MGIGLWLAAPAVRQLLQAGRLPELAGSLAECGLVPFTFNGFPQGDFHEPVVKHRVYYPTWWEARPRGIHAGPDHGPRCAVARRPGRQYFHIADCVGSSSPEPRADDAVCAEPSIESSSRLARLEAETGRLIYVCLEPEPGCVLQRSDDVVQFFEDVLWPIGNRPESQRYMRVCHDICHSAVMFEDQRDVLTRYAATGSKSARSRCLPPCASTSMRSEPVEQQQVKQALASFAEDRYLHQTCVRSASDGGGTVLRGSAAGAAQAPTNGQWRVHFHVPIYLERFGQLLTTQDDIRKCLQAVGQHPDLRHFEVETYAWSVLPQELQQAELADGIAQEMRWFSDRAASVAGCNCSCWFSRTR